MKLTWTPGSACLTCDSVQLFHFKSLSRTNYHSRSFVVRDDESNRTLVETKEIWAKLRIGEGAKTLEIWRQFFPNSSRCRRRHSLLELLVDETPLIQQQVCRHTRISSKDWKLFILIGLVKKYFFPRHFHFRFHGRQRLRGGRNCQKWREDGDRGVLCSSAQNHCHYWREFRRGKLRHVRARVRVSNLSCWLSNESHVTHSANHLLSILGSNQATDPRDTLLLLVCFRQAAVSLHVAELANFCDGRRASGDRPGNDITGPERTRRQRGEYGRFSSAVYWGNAGLSTKSRSGGCNAVKRNDNLRPGC